MSSPLTGTLTAIERERARFALDCEYIRSEAVDDAWDMATLKAMESVSPSMHHDVSPVMPLLESVTSDDSFREREIMTVLASDTDLTLNQVIARTHNSF